MIGRYGWAALFAMPVVALAAVLAVEVADAVQMPAAVAPAAGSGPLDEEVPAVVVAAAPAGASREIVERPLFFSSRRPLPPEPLLVAEARPEPEPPITFVLIGTILTGSSRTALVKPEREPPVELVPGQALNGWTVRSIDADRIMVRHGANEQLLGLRDFGAGRAQPAVARTPAARPEPPGPGGANRRPAAHR